MPQWVQIERAIARTEQALCAQIGSERKRNKGREEKLQTRPGGASAKFNVPATTISIIDINVLALARATCEIPADFRSRQKAEISNWPAAAVRARRFALGG
jgi:hypothetical protein